jgi:hypothetical protein
LSLTFEAYRQDLLLQLLGVDEDGGRLYGILFTGRPQRSRRGA